MLFIIQMGLTLGISLLLHFVIGKYPTPLPRSRNRKREIWVVIVLWAILSISLTITVLVIPQSELIEPTFGVVAITNLALIPFWVLIPLFVVLRMNHWTAKDLGFSMPRSRSVTIFSISVMALIGALTFFEPGFKPLPVWLVFKIGRAHV